MKNDEKHNWGYTFEVHLKSFFASWGYMCAKNPLIVLTIGVLFTIFLSLGLLNFSVITNPVELWSAPTSQARQEKNSFDDSFNPFYRVEQIIVSRKNISYFDYTTEKNRTYRFSNLFNLEFMENVLKLQKEVQNLKGINSNGDSIPLTKICLSPMNNNKCATQSPFIWFQNDYNNLIKTDRNYSYLDHLIACMKNPLSITDNTPLDLSCLGDYGGPSLPNVALGGFDLVKKDYWAATSFVITIMVNNHVVDSKNEDALAWEQTYLDFMKNYVSLNASANDMIVTYYSEVSQSFRFITSLRYMMNVLYLAFS